MTIWTRDVDKTNLLIEFLKFLDKNLQFTVEIVGKLLYFLDLKIIIDDKKFLTSVYSKPTDSCLYLDGTSCHATKSIDAISTGLAKRLKRIYSNDSNFVDHSKYSTYFASHNHKAGRLLQLLKKSITNQDQHSSTKNSKTESKISNIYHKIQPTWS